MNNEYFICNKNKNKYYYKSFLDRVAYTHTYCLKLIQNVENSSLLSKNNILKVKTCYIFILLFPLFYIYILYHTYIILFTNLNDEYLPILVFAQV